MRDRREVGALARVFLAEAGAKQHHSPPMNTRVVGQHDPINGASSRRTGGCGGWDSQKLSASANCESVEAHVAGARPGVA